MASSGPTVTPFGWLSRVPRRRRRQRTSSGRGSLPGCPVGSGATSRSVGQRKDRKDLFLFRLGLRRAAPTAPRGPLGQHDRRRTIVVRAVRVSTGVKQGAYRRRASVSDCTMQGRHTASRDGVGVCAHFDQIRDSRGLSPRIPPARARPAAYVSCSGSAPRRFFACTLAPSQTSWRANSVL